MTVDLECSICLVKAKDPHTPPDCNHIFCKTCLQGVKSAEEIVPCPLCQKEFNKKDMKPYVASRYCLDLSCKPNSGCKLVHFDVLCPNDGKSEKIASKKKPVKAEVAASNNDDHIPDLPKNIKYCTDIMCPGGEKAKCGKKHECDLIIRSSAS